MKLFADTLLLWNAHKISRGLPPGWLKIKLFSMHVALFSTEGVHTWQTYSESLLVWLWVLKFCKREREVIWVPEVISKHWLNANCMQMGSHSMKGWGHWDHFAKSQQVNQTSESGALWVEWVMWPWFWESFFPGLQLGILKLTLEALGKLRSSAESRALWAVLLFPLWT